MAFKASNDDYQVSVCVEGGQLLLLCPLFPTSRLPFSRRRHTRCFSVSSPVTDSFACIVVCRRSNRSHVPLTFTFTKKLPYSTSSPRPPPALRSHTNPAFSSNPRMSALQIPEAHVLDPPASSAGNGAAAAAKGGSDEDVLVAWVEAVTGTTVEGGIEAGLRDGVVLCELLNCYETGLVRRVNRSRMPFKQRENISFFLSACSKRLGIMSGDLFTTSDLYEAKNMKQVWHTMEIIARALKTLFPSSGNADLQEVSCADLADVSTLETSSRLRIPSVSRTDIHGRVRSSEQPGFNLATLVEDVATEVTPVVWSPGGTMDTALALEIPTVGAVGAVGDEGRGLEIELLAWICAVTGCQIEGGFASVLRDGTIICELLNAHEGAMVPRINRSRMPFKQMENIGFFLNAARSYLGLNARCDAAPPSGRVCMSMAVSACLHVCMSACLRFPTYRSICFSPSQSSC